MGVFGLSQVVNKLLNVQVMNNLLNVRSIGGGAVEPFAGASSFPKTFAKAVTGFTISNDSEPGKPGAGDITFIIDGNDSYTVKPGEVFSERFEPFITAQVISNNVPYRAYGMVALGSTAIPTAPPPDLTPPLPASNLTITGTTETTVSLSWTASASLDVLNYDLYTGTNVADGLLRGTANGTTFTVAGLAASTQYSFFARAKDGSNNRSEISNVVSATTAAPAPDTTPPVLNVSVPRSKPFEQQFTVSLSASDDRALDGIFYTLDGTTPVKTSTRYVGPVLISGTVNVTLKYIAYDMAGNASNVRTETFTYSQKVGGTGFGAAPTPAGGAWQDFVLTNLPSDNNSSGGWKGSPFFMNAEKRTSHVAFTCSVAGAQQWQLWECKSNPNAMIRNDGTTAPAGTTLLFAILRADGTTASPVDTAGLGPFLLASLQYEMLLEAGKWYCLAFNNLNSGTFHFAGTTSDIYNNVGGVITTGHVEGIYNNGNIPVVDAVVHTQNVVRPAAYDHQLYLKD